MSSQTLTPGQMGLIMSMLQYGVPLTRPNYIDEDGGDIDPDDPEEWGAEMESELPSFLQGAADDQVFDAEAALRGDYDGLTSSGDTFKAFFEAAQPIATAGRSDSFSNSAG